MQAIALIKTFISFVGMKVAVALNVAAGAQATMAIGSAVIAGSALVAKKAMSLFDMEIAVPDTDTSRQSTVKNTSEPQKIIYGEALVSGPISFIGLGGTDNEDLYQTIVLAGHQVNAITDVYFDDFVITNSQINNGSAAGGAVAQGEFAPQNNVNFVTIYKKLGLPSQTADSMLEYQFSNYTSNHRGDGIAYLAMKWTLNEDSAAVWDKYAPGNVKALVQGKKIYDPRLEETAVGTLGQDVTNTNYIAYSDNPALCLADYLTSVSYINAGSFVTNTDYRIEVIGTTDFTAIGASSNTVGLTFTATGVGSGTGKASVPSFGMGVLPSKIDWSAVKTAANGCDATVTVPNGNEKRFTCNGVVFATDTHKKNINKILSSMNGTLVYSNGRYVIRAGIYTAPTVSLNEDDLIGAISVKTSIDRSERVNTVKGLFIDPSQGHKMVEFPVVQLANELARDNYQVMEKETQFSMTNTSYGAQRLAYKIIKAGNEQKVITFPANYSALRITAGDRVQVTLSELNWTNKIFICAGWVFSEDGGIALTLREDSTAAYADPTSYSQVSGTGTITDAFRGVPSPSGLQVESAESKIFLNWVNPGRPTDFNTIEIWASSSNNRANAVKIGETNGTQFTHDDSNTAITITVGQTLYYWIRAKKNLGTATDTSALSEFFPTGATSGTSVTVNAAAVDWDNVADPTIGIDINNDTISINTGVANTTTGQTVATSGIEAGTTVTQGGITMNQGGSIKGGQSAYNTGTGFFLGYDSSAYKFSIGNASNEALTFDGTNLAVSGDITATSGTFTGTVNASAGAFTGDVSTDSKFIAGSGATSATMDGNDTNFKFYAGAAAAGDSPFKVDADGVVTADRIVITRPDDPSAVIFDSAQDGLVGVGLSSLSVDSDNAVAQVADELTSNTDYARLILSANAQTLTIKVLFPLGYAPFAISSAEDFPDTITLTLQVATVTNGTPGTFNNITGGSKTFTRRVYSSGAPSDDDYYSVYDSGTGWYKKGKDAIDSQFNLVMTSSGTFTAGDKAIRVQVSYVAGSGATNANPSSSSKRTLYFNSSTQYFTINDSDIIRDQAAGSLLTGDVILSAPSGARSISWRDSDTQDENWSIETETHYDPNSSAALYFKYDNGSTAPIAFASNGNILTLGDFITTAGAIAATTASIGGGYGSTGLSIAADGNLSTDGNVIVGGDLTVNGTTTTVDTDNLTVKDNNITLNYSTGDSSSTANNAGITIQDAVSAASDASILWKTASDTFEFSHGASIAGRLTTDSVTIDDDGSGSPLLRIQADDSSPWAIQFENSAIVSPNTGNLRGYLNHSNGFFYWRHQKDFGDDNYPKTIFQFSNGTTTQVGLTLTGTSAIFGGSITTAGNISISRSAPILILNDTDATTPTNQVGYITFQRQGIEKAWIGYGGASDDAFRIRNTEGPITINGPTNSLNLDVLGNVRLGQSTVNTFMYINGGETSTGAQDREAGIIWQKGGSQKWETYVEAGSNHYYKFYSYTDSQEVLQLRNDGDVQAPNGQFIAENFMFEGVGGKIRFGGTGDDGDYLQIQDVSTGSPLLALVQDSNTKISVDGSTGNFGVLTATPKATIDVAQAGNQWEDGILIRHYTGDTGWNIHAEDNTANELWFGYNADTSVALTSQSATTLMQLNSGGYVKITGAADYQLSLSGGASTWAGIAFSDNNGNDNFWYKGSTSTFAIGGGGSTAVGKKLHVDGRTSIGSTFDNLTTASQLYVYESEDSPSGTSGTLSSVISVAARTDAVGDGASVDFVSVWGGADLYQHTAVNAGWVVGRVGGIYDSGAGNGGALVFYTNSGTSATSGSTYANLTEKMRIKPNGEIHVGGTKVIDQSRNATFTSLTTPVLDGTLVYLTNSATPTGARFQIDVEGAASQQALYTYWYDGTNYNARTAIGGNNGNYFNVLGQFQVGGVNTIDSDRRGYFSDRISISANNASIIVMDDADAASDTEATTYISFQRSGSEFSWFGHYNSGSNNNNWLYVSSPGRVYHKSGAHYFYRHTYSASNRAIVVNNLGSAEADYTGIAYDSVVIAQSDVPTIRLRETLNAQELTFTTGNEYSNSSTIGATGRLVFATNRSAGEYGFVQTGTAMVIDTAGNVGIGLGTASSSAVNPSFTLDVERDTDAWVSRIYNTGSDANAQGLLVRSDATSAHAASVFGVYANGGYQMIVKSSGLTEFNGGAVTVNADNTINWGSSRGRLTWDASYAYVRGLSGLGLRLGGNNTNAIEIDDNTGTTARFFNTSYWGSTTAGIISWGGGSTFAFGNSYGMQAASGYALSLGSNGSWDRLVIDTSGNVYENSNKLRGRRDGTLTIVANTNYGAGWYRVAVTPIQALGYGARSAFKVKVYTSGGYLAPGTLEARCFKDWAGLLQISTVETAGTQYFTQCRISADANYAYFEVYRAATLNIAGTGSFQTEVVMDGLTSGHVLPYTENLTTGLSSPSYASVTNTNGYNPSLAVGNLVVNDDLFLPSGGIIYFNGQTSAGNGNYNINGNSGYFDTLNSGYDSDPLELCYVRGSHVTIGTGTYGSKHIRATEGVFTSANDYQLQLRGTDTWAGIKFSDNVNSTPRDDYLWYNGGNKTFAFGGGGSNVANKKLHVHGGMTVGSGYAATTLVANQIRSQGGLQSDNAIQINYTGNGNNGTDACLHILHNNADWKIKTEGKVGSTYYDYGISNHGAGSYGYYQTNSGAASVRIDYSGNAIFSGNVTAYGSPSDIRLKENIDVIENALDKVTKLRGVTFNYKKDGSRSTGLIAQELLEVLPEAVYEPEELNPDDEKFYAVRYGNTVGLLVEAIKELKVENDELKAMMQKILDKEK